MWKIEIGNLMVMLIKPSVYLPFSDPIINVLNDRLELMLFVTIAFKLFLVIYLKKSTKWIKYYLINIQIWNII